MNTIRTKKITASEAEDEKAMEINGKNRRMDIRTGTEKEQIE